MLPKIIRTFPAACCLIALLASHLPAVAAPPPTVLVGKGSEWRYLDDGSDLGKAWRAPEFADGGWKSGKAKLGYEDGAATTIGFGPDQAHKFITTYFRKEFTIPDLQGLAALRLDLLRDDGAAVYLNGVEVARSNLPQGEIRATTTARAVVGGAAETTYVPFTVPAARLVAGRNVLAVEVHQSGPTSSDLGFDLSLTTPGPPIAAPAWMLIRGPYLQMAAPTAMTVRWRTAKPQPGVVRYGTTPTALDQAAAETERVTEHIVALSGLKPGTTYFYSVGDATEVLADGPGCVFITPPPAGPAKPTRIWVLGDAGTKTINQIRVRNAFYAHAANHLPDLCLLLGDNAYDVGSDAEYQRAIFDTYPAMLRRVPFWSCLGNHETAQAVNYVDTYPYFKIFTFPTRGECGGVPSGTEHYYSFDYANIHFVVLDSMTANRAPTGAMATWLGQDLAATTATWIVAFFHHPPYTKGNHNSDVEAPLMQMRQNLLPILEAGGVDLVLNGHSHAYERSFLLDGHYGLSNTLTPAMKINGGDGRPGGDGAYLKPLTGPRAHLGAVYNVTGSAGQISGGTLNHPAMYLSANELGSVVLDINGNRLDSIFLRDNGTIRDTYSIIKQPRK